MKMKLDVYQRVYDNHIYKDGGLKPNTYLGTFDIVQKIYSDTYSGMWIGEKDGKLHIISEHEVSYMDAGSRFEVQELPELDAWIKGESKEEK